MSLFGDIAVQTEAEWLLEMMDKIRSEPAERQLRIIRAKLESIKRCGESGGPSVPEVD